MDRLDLSALGLALLQVSTGVNPALKRRLLPSNERESKKREEAPRLKDVLNGPQQVLSRLQRFIEHLPRAHVAYEGEVLEIKKQHDAAVSAVNEARHNPKLSMSDRNALGKAVMTLSEARRMIDKLRESNPESPRTLSSRDPYGALLRRMVQEEKDRACAIELAAQDSRVRSQTQLMTPNKDFRGSAKKGYWEQYPRGVGRGDSV
jgi:hypothetical protein